jgi:hypothetical protein
LDVPFTSIFYFLVFIGFGCFILIKGTKNEKFTSLSLLLLFIAQFPLLLIFYTFDSRYIILTVALIATMIGWAFSRFSIKNLYLKLTLLGIFFTLHLMGQIPLFKQVVANNILHTSVGWQYEAVKNFDSYFSQNAERQPLLITALPPHLVASYQKQKYSLLPLSPDQEFLQKGEYVWGSTVPYDSLIDGYRMWLTDGKEIYITNAYITHQQSVIGDYEEYKRHFNFELVSEGCLSACNIYKLSTLADDYKM